ncbi:MAG: ATP-binding protein [Chloroflexia bacterium]|nr:ATP-binding protein [Chloroflexia bacterium]
MKPIGEIMKNISIPRSTSEESTPRSSENDNCPICRGAGFVRLDAPVGSPNFSRLIPCVCKVVDHWDNTQRDLREFSNMDVVSSWTFDDFDANIKGTSDAYELAHRFGQNPNGWLVLVGPFGCGKTHLASAVANYALQTQHMRPIFAVVPDLLDYLRATFAPDSTSSYDKRFHAVRTADLLVLDDLGTENTTPWAREKLFQIVNHRYMERLPTVFTTNVDLDKLDGRVRSRLCDTQLSELVYMDADDYRMRNARVRGPKNGRSNRR